MWYVTRFDGRGSARGTLARHRAACVGEEPDHYRLVYKGEDEARARRTFEKVADSLRQGAVKLFHGPLLVQSQSAPRLRRRW